MQTVDIQSQAAAVRQIYEMPAPKRLENENPQRDAEKSDTEPVRNGDSFPAMIKKMIAADKEVKNGYGKVPSENIPAQKETGILNFGKFSEAKYGKETEEPQEKDAGNGLKKPENSFKRLKKEAVFPKKAFKNTKTSGIRRPHDFDDEAMLKNLLSDSSEKIDILSLLPENVNDEKEIPLLSGITAADKGSEKKNLSPANEKATLYASRNISLTKPEKTRQDKKIGTVTENVEKKAKTAHKPNRPVISVEDLRSAQNLRADAAVHEAGSEQRVETDNSVDMILDFRGKAQTFQQGGEHLSQSQGETQKTTPSFSSLLAQEIRESSADFVQAGKIVLRDNNAGEIRVQLRPENLGAVKIKLELTEGKKISGAVTVSTKEAYEAFEESLDGLVQEFKQNGFELSQFDLNWSGHPSQEPFTDDFGFEIAHQNAGQNLNTAKKNTDNLHMYGYVYGSTVDILI